jgi:uncharacterized protein
MIGPAGNPIQAAIADRDLDRLEDAIRAGADLSEDGPALLRSAVAAELADAQAAGEEPHVDLTVLLLAGGADPRRPDGPDGSAIDFATARDHWLAALVMDQWGRAPAPDPDPVPAVTEDEYTPANQAIEMGHFRKLYDVLAAGTDVHEEQTGWNLLMMAASSASDARAQTGETHLDELALLLAMGADPWRGPRGKPPLGAGHMSFVDGFTPATLLFTSWTRDWPASHRPPAPWRDGR